MQKEKRLMKFSGFFKIFCLFLLTELLIYSLSGCNQDDSNKDTFMVRHIC